MIIATFIQNLYNQHQQAVTAFPDKEMAQEFTSDPARLLAAIDRFIGQRLQSAEAQRIESGWPRMGAEIIAGETIPAETGLNDVAVNFKKGCYPGQELVERMDSRGSTAPRRCNSRASTQQTVAQRNPAVQPARTSVGQWTPR